MSQFWDIQKFVSADGQCRFDKWFDSLAPSVQTRVDRRLDRLGQGNFGDYKALGKGLYELRLMFGPGYRIYYGIVGNSIVLLLVGSNKAAQRKGIKIARQLWTEFLKEKGE